MKLANDIAAFTNVIGLDNLGLTWQLANVPWESDDDYLSENNDAIRLQLSKDFLEQLLRKS